MFNSHFPNDNVIALTKTITAELDELKISAEILENAERDPDRSKLKEYEYHYNKIMNSDIVAKMELCTKMVNDDYENQLDEFIHASQQGRDLFA